jgi:dihydrofolate synthase/folylpolyglutamate synthase
MIVDRRETARQAGRAADPAADASRRSDPGRACPRNPSPRIAPLQDWLAHIERLHAQPDRTGSGARAEPSVRALGSSMGVPVITVGGTNGKGSTCAMLERILLCAGYRVGCTPRRICSLQRAGAHRRPYRPADDAGCAPPLRGWRRRAATTPLTYFEFGTLAAWQAFAEAGVDAVILEVGLGGRLDAVNAFDADCAIVTSIDLDHMDSSARRARRSASRRPAFSVPAGRPSSAMRSRRKACSSMQQASAPTCR